MIVVVALFVVAAAMVVAFVCIQLALSERRDARSLRRFRVICAALSQVKEPGAAPVAPPLYGRNPSDGNLASRDTTGGRSGGPSRGTSA
jgi:hypothetical protein